MNWNWHNIILTSEETALRELFYELTKAGINLNDILNKRTAARTDLIALGEKIGCKELQEIEPRI